MRVGGFEPRAISGSVSPSLGRYESWRLELGRYRIGGLKPGAIREPAGPSLGRYGSRRVRAWGDMGVGGFEPGAISESDGSSLGDIGVGRFEPGAISESDGSSLGRYRGRHFRLALREDAWSHAVRGAERRGAGLETGGPSRTGLPRDQRRAVPAEAGVPSRCVTGRRRCCGRGG